MKHESEMKKKVGIDVKKPASKSANYAANLETRPLTIVNNVTVSGILSKVHFGGI